MDEQVSKAMLLRMGGYSITDIAAELGVPEDAVSALLEQGEHEMASADMHCEPSEMLLRAEEFAERRRRGTFRSADFTRPLMKALAQELKPRGFRRRRANLFREVEPGLLHTINVQSGRNYFGDPSATYGHFTVNLEVGLEEVFHFFAEAGFGPTTSQFGPGYGIVADTRLGILLTGVDTWWPMEGEPSDAARTVLGGLESHGFAFFDRFSSRQRVEEELPRASSSEVRGAAPLLLAGLRLGRGDRAGASEILHEYAQRDLREPHRSWVYEVIRNLGL